MKEEAGSKGPFQAPLAGVTKKFKATEANLQESAALWMIEIDE